MADDCLFCRIAAGELPATVVREDERTLAFMDINPWSRGHVLVIPRTHAAGVHDIDPDDLAAVFAAGQEIARRQTDALEADGVNLFHSTGSIAGQIIMHFHLHVVPRYEGDGIGNPFGPANGDHDEIAAAGALLTD